ncbi:thiamine phosphate synthase [Methyloradius palustris]|uniref:Thiamine-phosphate synthase n=1 Tax=Methyloradius palustris TaxID=2778876 RepID=A0A8E4AXA7_9PROT|nr:thiamine phosphate synthase [Methyloradius palustris]BCM26256.1 thiamine-phosphate synthase [Methyloradius palustris]
MKSKKIKGLYAVTADEANTEHLLSNAKAALSAGINVLQYRNKTASKQLAAEQAEALLLLCREYNVPLIINDDVELALKIDADGVHLGASDGNLRDARKKLGEDKIIGASCYNRLEIAQFAAQNGVDYVAFGACFVSGTKPNAPKADLKLFTQAKQVLDLPIVAIGGITLENAPSVIQAGADAIAVIGALWNVSDGSAGDAQAIQKTTQQFTQLFGQPI